MKIEDDRELKILIRRIAEQVIRRILEPEKAETGALAIIASFIADADPLREYLSEKYGDEVTCAGEESAVTGAAYETVRIDTLQDKQRLMASLKNYSDILLVSPPLWMLKNITAGDDRGFYEHAIMRALLWGKNVTILLDYERPKFSRGTFFEGLNDALSAAEGMGAKVVSLKLSVGKPEGRLELVTETEIEDARKLGRERVRCAPGAIVTPLARDTAKELGVEIDE